MANGSSIFTIPTTLVSSRWSLVPRKNPAAPNTLVRTPNHDTERTLEIAKSKFRLAQEQGMSSRGQPHSLSSRGRCSPEGPAFRGGGNEKQIPRAARNDNQARVSALLRDSVALWHIPASFSRARARAVSRQTHNHHRRRHHFLRFRP